MRETWLNENQRLVSQDNFGNDIAAVEAATKKHEAIETDIMVSMIVWLKLYSKTSQLLSAFLCSVKFARLFCKD